MAIKGEVCTQRENSCVPGCAFVCAHVRVSARIRAHVCVKERCGAVRNTSASLYVRQRTGGGDALRCCAFFYFFILIGPLQRGSQRAELKTEALISNAGGEMWTGTLKKKKNTERCGKRKRHTK